MRGGETPPNIFRHSGTMVHYFPYVFPASKPNIWTEAEAEPEAQTEAQTEAEPEEEAEAELGVMHGKMNFFVIIFDRLNLSKTKDQCVRIKSPKYF